MISALALLCTACMPEAPPAGEPIVAPCTVTDGDTIRCGDERIRLLAIDAPELGGHCRPGRRCVEGDGDAARAALARLMAGGSITVQRIDHDRYGRTLAVVYAGGRNLSCAMVESGQAEYVRRWDNRRAVARECPAIDD